MAFLSRWIQSLYHVHFYYLIPGLGCGVLGLALKRSSKSMGAYAEALLKSLEYRGHDSTGAAFLGEDKKITLLKDVGAPSLITKTLGIDKSKGKIFCGQVRWATFGRVDQLNAQPHVVGCKEQLFGAHNGNITNSISMKESLREHGHQILSDNDGEIVVHTVEEAFESALKEFPGIMRLEKEVRIKCMRKAIPTAIEKLEGSFAAVIVDPKTEMSYAIKAGSSLYFGMGEMKNDGPFALASSDLTAVLKFTKRIIGLKEGQFVEYSSKGYKVFAFKDIKVEGKDDTSTSYKKGEEIFLPLNTSKLRTEDTGLKPQYDFFMEQEIDYEFESAEALSALFDGGGQQSKKIFQEVIALNQLSFYQKIMGEDVILTLDSFNQVLNSNEWGELRPYVEKTIQNGLFDQDKAGLIKSFSSSEKNTLFDFVGEGGEANRLLLALVFDSIIEVTGALNFEKSVNDFTREISQTFKKGRSTYVIACGTSFHAAKTAALYFSEIAGIPINPILPGELRGQYENCLRDGDLLIGVSQSGETKDLIDVVDFITKRELDIKKIMLVNNANSTLGQEKSDIMIPINSGPEIAVPATKSFMNQLILFYFLAIKSYENLINESEKRDNSKLKKLDFYRYSYREIPRLIEKTLSKIKKDGILDEVARINFLAPSMQILATRMTGIAKEGALKIRETVLNHTEGGEASEFKHGPNTILGKNTLYGPDTLMKVMGKLHKDLANGNINEIISNIDENYPLFYVTGPNEKDVNLTISQINTHKIRGSNTFIIAEENKDLRENILYQDPKGLYRSHYIVLPTTHSNLMTTFSATIALQLLGLKMSIAKMNYLNQIGMKGHGVHPDVPKNVSKSITVD